MLFQKCQTTPVKCTVVNRVHHFRASVTTFVYFQLLLLLVLLDTCSRSKVHIKHALIKLIHHGCCLILNNLFISWPGIFINWMTALGSSSHMAWTILKRILDVSAILSKAVIKFLFDIFSSFLSCGSHVTRGLTSRLLLWLIHSSSMLPSMIIIN